MPGTCRRSRTATTRELPGAVYTKGFLRNYALYLGLDPVEILDRWHDEQDPGQRTSSPTMVAPPQPLTDPRRGFTFTPSLVVAAALGLVVLLFVGYVGMQLFRFSQVPELSLDGPSVIQVAQDQTSVELTGASPVHATVQALDAAGTMVQSDRQRRRRPLEPDAAGPEGQQPVHAHRA